MATSLNALLNRMTDMEHQTIEKDFFGQLYGPQGSGKTTLAAGLAQRLRGDGEVLWVDSSDGWVSLDNIPSLKRGLRHFPYQSAAELPALAQAIKKKAKGFEKIRVVVLDEASSIAKDILNVVLRERLGTPDDEIPNVVPDWTDYFPQKEIMGKAVEAFHAVPGLHVILVAHSQIKEDHRKVKITMPDYSPKLWADLGKPMHVNALVSAKVVTKGSTPVYERSIQCLPTALVDAKCRIGGLGLNETFADFVDIVGRWVEGDQMAEDLTQEELDTLDVPEDELPDDGIPVAEDDDEPAFVEALAE